jgi:hypothetical protein
MNPIVALGGLVVRVLAMGHKVAGSNPADDVKDALSAKSS